MFKEKYPAKKLHKNVNFFEINQIIYTDLFLFQKLQKGRKSLQEKYNNTLNTNEPDSPKNEEKEKYVPKTEMINYDEMITIDENNIKTEVMEENDKQVFPLASKINSNLENFEIHSENLFLKCEPLEENITRDVGCQTRETFFNCRNEKSRKEESKITAIQSFEKSLSEDKEKCLFYTSLEFSQVKTLLSFLTPKCNDLITWNYDNKSVSFPKCSNSQKFTSIQELIVTLVYLRRALPFRDLSYRFDVSNNLMKNIIITWIKFMYIELSEQLKSGMFVSRSVSDKIPALFKEFKNLRVVVTCAEFYSRSLPLRSIENEDHTYSRKDTSMISKALIGCTPTGRISFVTPVYDGTTSNRKIFIESNLSEFIKPDDLVLIDKEVVIKDLIINQRAKCHIPQFLEGNRVLQSDNDLRTKLINQQKDVINKIISQLKQFHILREELSHEMSKFASEILFICVCIKNLNFKWAEKL